MADNIKEQAESAGENVGLSDLLVAELRQERRRQISKGFNSEWDDNVKNVENFCNDIIAYTTWAKQMWFMRSPRKYRRRMKQIAALAIAACESFDRQKGN